MTVLSEQSLKRLRDFLEEDASKYDTDAPQGTDPYAKIFAWAQESEYGGLPQHAARPFADWLSNCWSNWTEEPVKVKDVLDGAITAFCGGRVMPK